MPLHSITRVGEDTRQGLWQISESREELAAILGTRLNDKAAALSKVESAGLHWYASRVLLQEMFSEGAIHLHKNQYNKPYLFIDETPYFISITHSHEWAGVMVSQTCDLGMDLEKNDIRIERVCHKFMNDAEQDFASDTLTKTLIWSAKESMYKVYGEKELDFRKHMSVQAFTPGEQGIFKGVVSKSGTKLELLIHYRLIEHFVLTYSMHKHSNTHV